MSFRAYINCNTSRSNILRIFVKHGFVPTIGFQNHVDYRLGLYNVMITWPIGIRPWRGDIAVCWRGYIQYRLEWDKNYKPFFKFTVWKEHLIYSKDWTCKIISKKPPVLKYTYKWKREN